MIMYAFVHFDQGPNMVVGFPLLKLLEMLLIVTFLSS